MHACLYTLFILYLLYHRCSFKRINELKDRCCAQHFNEVLTLLKLSFETKFQCWFKFGDHWIKSRIRCVRFFLRLPFFLIYIHNWVTCCCIYISTFLFAKLSQHVYFLASCGRPNLKRQWKSCVSFHQLLYFMAIRKAPIVGNPRVILIDSLFHRWVGEKACGLKPMVCDDAFKLNWDKSHDHLKLRYSFGRVYIRSDLLISEISENYLQQQRVCEVGLCCICSSVHIYLYHYVSQTPYLKE